MRHQPGPGHRLSQRLQALPASVRVQPSELASGNGDRPLAAVMRTVSVESYQAHQSYGRGCGAYCASHSQPRISADASINFGSWQDGTCDDSLRHEPQQVGATRRHAQQTAHGARYRRVHPSRDEEMLSEPAHVRLVATAGQSYAPA
jgi:hypothetical protein